MTDTMKPLEWFESVQVRAKELREEESWVKEEIRNGLVDRAIVFLDMVGSTQFKQDHKDSPEVWILRVRQFSELVAAAISECHGMVVKYIGDEVMAVFENINDAQNLVLRVEEIQENLSNATGFPTRIKVSADYGKVYNLRFTGHAELDPQGPAVDRAARIASFGEPGEVVASADFAAQTPKLKWMKVGQTELKGLGAQVLYQVGHVTIDLSPKVTILQEEFQRLQACEQELKVEVQQLITKNARLARELQAVGEQPASGDLADEGEDKNTCWEAVLEPLQELRKIIKMARVPASEYARFLFLWNTDLPGERYNKFEGKTFDSSIEAGLISKDDDGFYVIKESHPRNVRAIKLMRAAKRALDDYLEVYSKDEDDLFEWDLCDPEFWREYVGVDVVSD